MEPSRGILRKVLLFAFIVGVPLSFILFFSSGSHEFQILRYWGPNDVDQKGDTLRYTVKDFTLRGGDGRGYTLASFSNKIIVALVLSPQCPENCAIQADKFKMLVYDEIAGSPRKFHDVHILAHVKDYYSDQEPDLALVNQYFDTDTSVMTLVTGSSNPLFDFKPTEDALNLLRDEHAKVPGRKGYHQYALLIDKERHVRGVYDLSHSQRIRALMEELRILKREYHVQSVK